MLKILKKISFDDAKVKKYNILNNILNIIMMIMSIVLLIYFINIKMYDRIFSCLSIYVVLFFPKLLDKTKFSLNEKYKLIYTLFVFLAHFLGSIVNLYYYVWWYDLFMHFLSGVLSVVVGIYILDKVDSKSIKNKFIYFIYLIGFVSFVALTWEMIEYLGDIFFNMNLQHSIETGVKDTMHDIIIALLGGFITCFIVNKKNKT